MKKVFKWLAVIVFLAIVAIAAAAWWFIRAPQANSSGVATVAGLKQDLSITRNAQGVPHIQAANVNDAYFGLGFVHAQDRLWQMMFHRRVSQGRLSEVLGEATLDTDKFIRTLSVTQRAKQAVAEMKTNNPVALARMQAYADGVNAFLANRSGPLPVEFTLTGAPAPEPWKVEDSAAWTIMMAWDLGGNWRRELRRLAYANTWSVDKINDLMRVNDGEIAPQTTDYAVLYKQLGIYSAVNSLAQQQLIAAAPESGIDGIGSNNWVLAGSRTVSGKPLLANDPHLTMGTPALWYLASLSAGQGKDDPNAWHAVGATIPAMGSVVLGRNAHIAWGFTNTAPDVQDTYIERINPQNPNEYQTPTGWAAFDMRPEVIKIKGKPDLQLTVRSTRHGAVISDVVKAGAAPNQMPPLKDTLAAPYVLALQWTALMPGDSSAAAGVQLSHAKNWDEFLVAAKGFHAPQQNIVYADMQGNIGYIAPARVPVRKAENDLKGLAPALGWEAKYDWDGWIPFEQLPRKFNPPEGYIATANEKINAAGDPFLTSEWALPYRAQRINALLNAGQKQSVASTAAIQTDITSLGVQQFLKLAVPLLKDSEWKNKLAGFDGVMRTDSATPLVASALWRHLSRRLFADDLGEKAYLEAADPSMVWLPMLAALEGKTSTDWCDDSRTAKKESCAEQVNAALADAIADLTTRYGSENKWQWGKAHALQADHAPFSKVAALNGLFSASVPLGGDSFTVVQLKNQFGREATPYRATHGPSYRGIFDMSVPIANLMQTTGQSGMIGNAHYKDFVVPWSKGQTIAVPVGAASPEQASNPRWILKAAP